MTSAVDVLRKFSHETSRADFQVCCGNGRVNSAGDGYDCCAEPLTGADHAEALARLERLVEAVGEMRRISKMPASRRTITAQIIALQAAEFEVDKHLAAVLGEEG